MSLARRLKRVGMSAGLSPVQDAADFALLYDRAHVRVYRYVYGLLGGSVQDAEDLTAETFMRAWKTRDRFRGNGDAAIGWLLKIARHLVIDAYRRRTVRGTQVSLEATVLPAEHGEPEDGLLAGEQARQLWRALERLPTEQREMLVLRFMLGWRVNRLAEHLGLAENTVSVTIRRALARLRREWTEG